MAVLENVVQWTNQAFAGGCVSRSETHGVTEAGWAWLAEFYITRGCVCNLRGGWAVEVKILTTLSILRQRYIAYAGCRSVEPEKTATSFRDALGGRIGPNCH